MNVTSKPETTVRHIVTLEMSDQEFYAFCDLMARNHTIPDDLYQDSEETEKAVLSSLMQTIFHTL